MNEILAVVANVGEPAEIRTIVGNLDGLRGIVQGSIELYPLSLGSRRYSVYLNEEGRLIPLPPNRVIGVELIHGNIVVTKTGPDGEETSLDQAEAEAIQAHLNSDEAMDWHIYMVTTPDGITQRVAAVNEEQALRYFTMGFGEVMS
jgi:hypothetical protein